VKIEAEVGAMSLQGKHAKDASQCSKARRGVGQILPSFQKEPTHPTLISDFEATDCGTTEVYCFIPPSRGSFVVAGKEHPLSQW
jgi:hypothetical protein